MKKRKHYNGKYLLEDHVLNEKYEVQLWKVIETERLDYNYEIFVNMPKFYASCYPDVKPYEVFNEIKKEIVELIAKYPDRGEMMLDFLMVAKYFERIGDHATNVAEWVEFSITGERPVMTKYTFDQKTMEEKKLARDERVFKRVQ